MDSTASGPPDAASDTTSMVLPPIEVIPEGVDLQPTNKRRETKRNLFNIIDGLPYCECLVEVGVQLVLC